MKILQLCTFNVIGSAGGAEKVFCNIANRLSNCHEVINVYADDNEGTPFYNFNNKEKLYNLLKSRVKYPIYIKIKSEILKLLSKIGLWNQLLPRNIYKNAVIASRFCIIVKENSPDIIICYRCGDLDIIEKSGFDLQRVIVMFHGFPNLEGYTDNSRRLMKKVGLIQVLMPSYKRVLEDLGYKNIVVIGNVIENNECNICAFSAREKSIVCVARLDKFEKRQHLLIEAFAKIAHKYPEWNLYLYGGNSVPRNYKFELKKIINKYDLDDRVLLMGITNDAINSIRKSSVFVLPSPSEGFSLALGEAMSLGIPCIGFKSAASINELIIDGFNGYLSDDGADNLSSTLEHIIIDDEARQNMGNNAISVAKNYYPDIIYGYWENVINNMYNQ